MNLWVIKLSSGLTMLQKSMKEGESLVASAIDSSRPVANIPCVGENKYSIQKQ